jgi:anti-sigma B factor antagonist
MTFTQQDINGKDLIKIEGSLSIYEVSKFRDELITCLETMDEIALDLSGVTDCDTAGVQLLYAARKTTDQGGHPIRIEKASAPVVDALNGAGMNSGDILGLLESKNSKPISKEEV